MASSVRVVDRGADDILTAVREAAKGMEVRVGVIGKEAEAQHQADDLTVADIASSHEFGVGVPQRSWLRDWCDEHQRANERELRLAAASILRGRSSLLQEAHRFGVASVGSIQERMSRSIPPPNAPATIRRKGSDTTLIDTGQFRSSITYDVQRDGQVVPL